MKGFLPCFVQEKKLCHHRNLITILAIALLAPTIWYFAGKGSSRAYQDFSLPLLVRLLVLPVTSASVFDIFAWYWFLSLNCAPERGIMSSVNSLISFPWMSIGPWLGIVISLQLYSLLNILHNGKQPDDHVSSKMATAQCIMVMLHPFWAIVTLFSAGRHSNQFVNSENSKAKQPECLIHTEPRNSAYSNFSWSPFWKPYLGYMISLSIVIAMGINSFLLEEVENWKLMSSSISFSDVFQGHQRLPLASADVL